MFCVVQEIPLKKQNKYGYPKELISKYLEMSIQGEDLSHYWHTYSENRFERPICKGYKISIHQNYRENGKLKKKQFSLCTVNYYDFATGGFTIYDYCNSKIVSAAHELSSCIDDIYDLIGNKLEPLVESIMNEFKQTEEFITHQEHERITTLYALAKTEFNEKYQCSKNKYDQIYDVYGNLMNPAKLEQVEAEYKARMEYEKKSSSYQEEYYSNYKERSYSGGSSYYSNSSSNYKDEDKDTFKQFYRTLSKQFHPDSNPGKDTSKQMQLINQLKKEWGV